MRLSDYDLRLLRTGMFLLMRKRQSEIRNNHRRLERCQDAEEAQFLRSSIQHKTLVIEEAQAMIERLNQEDHHDGH